jgi:hypothetical protein
MQKWYRYKRILISLVAVVIISGFIFLVPHYRNFNGHPKKFITETRFNRITGDEDNSSYIKFRTFQNSDSSWGFTIFMNSRPYIHNKNVPVSGSNSGFRSKNDAEKVADLFSKMLRKGNLNPKINKNTLDSLGI